MIAPPLLSRCGLSSDVGYLVLVGPSVLLSMIVQKLVAILVFSQEDMSCLGPEPICELHGNHKAKLSNVYIKDNVKGMYA